MSLTLLVGCGLLLRTMYALHHVPLEFRTDHVIVANMASPWENGYCESFNYKLRGEFLNGEIFYSMKEVQVLAERWRIHYNTIRPHSSLGYRSPAPETWLHEIKTGYGEVESRVRLPFPHTLDDGERSTKPAALN